MKSINIARRAGLLGALLALAMPAVVLAQNAVDNSTPQKLVETSARVLLADLDKNRAVYRKDITGLYKVIDTQFLPHVDVQFAAQQVLGKHWRTATAEQRKRFVDAFYRSMLTTYGNALLEFTADDLRIKPFRGDANAERASVDTEIKRSNGASVAVQYSLRKTPQGWKVWDVVIEGISYVKSFREDFGLEIDQKGLDALLARLESTKGAAK
ncbi:MAG TPA: ABC transporter substrate-binding protein [Steroidobacteraceae bacterium]|nr:ABC transporter substrate-binding protein [Steroidobacteraceae bacterium]